MIREFRERHGLTQQELAAALGLGKNRLSEYETGIGAPSWMRYALAGYAEIELGVSPKDLGWIGRSESRSRAAAAAQLPVPQARAASRPA